MGENTKIEWADHTMNFWVGCTKVSPACDFCYAEAWAKRSGHPELWAGERRRTMPANWRQPHKWNLDRLGVSNPRARVFTNSLADFFDNQVPPQWRREAWHVIDQTPNLDWLILTKRPQNIVKMLPGPDAGYSQAWGDGWPNVWLGTTCENQEIADRNILVLLATPAAKRFVSLEPLLGPIDLEAMPFPDGDKRHHWSALTGQALMYGEGVNGNPDMIVRVEKPLRNKLDWVIAGGESGPHARPMHSRWARDIRDQCASAGVPFHFKQWGEWAPGAKDGRVADIALDVRGEKAGHVRSLGGMISPEQMSRFGKRAAGRLLDGIEWNQMPGRMYECRTCSAPAAAPGFCERCAPRVVSEAELKVPSSR